MLRGGVAGVGPLDMSSLPHENAKLISEWVKLGQAWGGHTAHDMLPVIAGSMGLFFQKDKPLSLHKAPTTLEAFILDPSETCVHEHTFTPVCLWSHLSPEHDNAFRYLHFA